ncbi:protein kinase [Planctomycetota bacterium]
MPAHTCADCGREFKVPEGADSAVSNLCPNCGVTRQLYAGGTQSALNTITDKHGIDPDATIDLSTPEVDAPTRVFSGTRTTERYIVTNEIDRGGMGAILRSLDQDIRRQVAMKVMLAGENPSRDMIERFVEEAQVTGQLEHPNIVPVHELGLDRDGSVYFTMKMVHGRSLGDLLQDSEEKNAGPELGELLEIFLKVCDGVAFAHSRGVIHRDLKPQNIMIGRYGEVLVMDWGLCKVRGHEDAKKDELIETVRTAQDTTHTVEGMVAGTPSYMPPEQAEGRISEVDEKSDVYSLGAVLYEMLTLAPPFTGKTTDEIIQKVTEGKVVAPDQLEGTDNVPSELSAICMKAMAHDKQDRYPNVQDLARDIRLFLQGRAVSAKEDTFAESIVKLVRRNRQICATAAAAAAVLLAVGIYSYIGIKEQRDAALEARAAEEKQKLIAEERQKEAEKARNAENKQRQAAERERDRAERETYRYGIMQARQLLAAGRNGEAFDLLTGLAPGRRGWEHAYLLNLAADESERKPMVEKHHTGCAHAVAYSPDGTMLASAGDDNVVRIWDARTGRPLRVLTGHEKRILSIAFSPDGKRIVSGSDDTTAKVWDAASGECLLTFRKHGEIVSAVAFSRDGEKAASGDVWGTIRIWDPTNGSERMMRGGGNGIHAIAFSRDGQRLVRGGAKGDLAVLDAATGKHAHELGRYKSDLSDITSLTFSPDGSLLAASCEANIVRVWNAETYEEIREYRGHSRSVLGAAFSPDGGRIASASGDGTVRIWNVRSGRELLRMENQPGPVRAVAFSPDGTALAACGDGGWVRTYPTPRNAAFLTLTGHLGAIRALAFSPDGTRVASGSDDWTGKVWDLVTTRELFSLKGCRAAVGTAAFNDDGSLVAVGDNKGGFGVGDVRSRTEIFLCPSDSGSCIVSIWFPRKDHMARVDMSGSVSLVDFRERLHYSGQHPQMRNVSKAPERKRYVFPFLEKRGAKPTAIAVSPNGTYAASGGHDSVIRIWDVSAVPPDLRPVTGVSDVSADSIQTVKKPEKLLPIDEAIALAKKDDSRAIPTLVWFVHQRRRTINTGALKALIGMKNPAVNSHLVSFLDSRDRLVSGKSIKALRERADEKTIAMLLEVLKTGTSRSKSAAASIIGKTGGPGAVELLIPLLKDREAQVRSSAAWALGHLPDARATGALIPLAEDTDTSAREWAAFALGTGGDERAGAPLEKLLNDPNPRVRWRTEKAINKWRKRYRTEELPVVELIEQPVTEIDTVLRRIMDTKVPGVEWTVYDKLFVGRTQNKSLRNFEAFLEMRGTGEIEVYNLAFDTKHVWAATDKGAFCYERTTKAWIEYAVNKEHIGLPVHSIEFDKDGGIVFCMRIDGRDRTYVLNPADSTWVAK